VLRNEWKDVEHFDEDAAALGTIAVPRSSKIGSSYGAGHPPIVLRCIHDAALGE
jgi:hypothetical protein